MKGRKMKNILWSIGIIIVLFLLLVGGLWANDWYHTRISTATPQSNTQDCPYDRLIKGNSQSGIYHIPDGQYYQKTWPEQCFATEDEARQAGYRKSSR